MAPPDYAELLVQRHLPGLNAAEHTVAMRWLQEKGMRYEEILFNVSLGPVPAFDFPMSEEQRRQAEYLYRTRADIVARSGNDVTIIEVKERATKGALGQLAHYAYWYRKEHPERNIIAIRVIAARSDEGIAETLLAHGVDLELYGGTV